MLEKGVEASNELREKKQEGLETVAEGGRNEGGVIVGGSGGD